LVHSAFIIGRALSDLLSNTAYNSLQISLIILKWRFFGFIFIFKNKKNRRELDFTNKKDKETVLFWSKTNA